MSRDSDELRPATMADLALAVKQSGRTVIQGISGAYWMSYEICSLERWPVLDLSVPLAKEVRRALWQSGALVATYVRAPDDCHPENAWLYVCEDQDYKLENLKPTARRDIRRAQRAFRFEFLTADAFLAKGVRCFCDTRARVGLSDGTPQTFKKRYESFLENPANRILGAWMGDSLAGFMSAIAVDDWVVVAAYAADEHLRLCPNNGMIHFALEHFLAQHKFRLVNFGLSSIQEVGKIDSLDRFKKKVGFVAKPVHRAFVFHPLLTPFANGITLWGLRTAVRMRPRSRTLRKATGLLATHLQKRVTTDQPSTDVRQAFSEEEARIVGAYRRRETIANSDRYSPFSPATLFLVQQRERCTLKLLDRYGFRHLNSKRIFDVGCGMGSWLRDFIKWGARPENVGGIDLLPQRIAEARQLCPQGVDLRCGSATKLPFPDASFDLVIQSTVFTSILDSNMKQQIAREMLRIVKPEGLILWYDFHVDNPRNPDVHRVKRREIRRLFPNCRIELRRVTLAPPIARSLAPRSRLLCCLLEKMPLLCSHYMGAIRKPADA